MLTEVEEAVAHLPDAEKLRYALAEYDGYRGWPGSMGAEMVANDLAEAARLYLEELSAMAGHVPKESADPAPENGGGDSPLRGVEPQ